MKRIICITTFVGIVGLVWLGNLGRSGGQGQYTGLFDKQFCMDANGDGEVNITDAIGILSYLFLDDPPAKSCVAQDFSLDDRYARLGHTHSYYLPDGGVTTEKIADGGVTTEKINVPGCPSLPDLCAEHRALMERVAVLEGALNTLKEIRPYVSVVELDDGKGGKKKTIRFEGVNVQIVNGLGATNGRPEEPFDFTNIVVNGLGNLIIGYNELYPDPWPFPDPVKVNDRSGSHNLIMGILNNHTNLGGLISGLQNTISGAFSFIAAGSSNIASGSCSTILNGVDNTASGSRSLMLSGDRSEARANGCTVLCGHCAIVNTGGCSLQPSGTCPP